MFIHHNFNSCHKFQVLASDWLRRDVSANQIGRLVFQNFLTNYNDWVKTQAEYDTVRRILLTMLENPSVAFLSFCPLLNSSNKSRKNSRKSFNIKLNVQISKSPSKKTAQLLYPTTNYARKKVFDICLSFRYTFFENQMYVLFVSFM